MSHNHNSSTKVYAENGAQIGVIRGDTFYRRFKSNHVLRQPEPALAIGEHALAQLQAAGVTMLEYRNAETGVTYRASLEHFLAKSTPIDRGHGKQKALALNGWMQTRSRQMALFGGVA